MTDTYEFSIRNEMPSADRGLKKALLLYKEVDGIVYEKEIMYEHGGLLADGAREAFTELNHRADLRAEETVFFPPFRRIEGGFALESLHQFVSSISTADIEALLTRKYADISEKTNAMYLDFSRFIMDRLGAEHVSEDVQSAVKFREDMRKRLDQVNQNRANLMRPFDKLTELIAQVFKDKGITISQNLTFGQTKAAIRARILSAGEKQMFSFLSYNAFAKDSVIFIG